MQIISTAINALKVNLLRSLLTMLGVIIGVFAVIMMISLSQGIKNYVTEEFDKLGSNLVFVSPGTLDVAGDPATQFSRNKLEAKHVRLIEANASDYVSKITPYHLVGANAEFKSTTYFSELVGVSYEGATIFNYVIDEGRNFSLAQQKANAKVAVIGPVIKEELFSNQSPIGRSIKFGDDDYKIIGTFSEKGSNYDDQILVPFTSIEKTFDIKNYISIVIQVPLDKSPEIAVRQVEFSLLRDLKKEEFTVLSQADFFESIEQILGALTIALSLIASISLLVGGIGIMNIMLVNVTERIREIGLRKALGASQRNIATQFLLEAIFLSFLGGFIGLALGYGGTLIAQNFINAQVTAFSIMLALGCSILIGVVFGTYPAINASRKDPIEALRYE